MLIYWLIVRLIDCLICLCDWLFALIDFVYTFILEQLIFTDWKNLLKCKKSKKSLHQLGENVKLIVWDRQAVSPITCQLWQTSHSLQFECLAEQCQMIFQNSFEHPMLKNCNNLHLISRMQLPLLWIGGVFKNQKISAKFYPQNLKKKLYLRKILSTASIPCHWKILQFFQGILVTESNLSYHQNKRRIVLAWLKQWDPQDVGWTSWQDFFCKCWEWWIRKHHKPPNKMGSEPGFGWSCMAYRWPKINGEVSYKL